MGERAMDGPAQGRELFIRADEIDAGTSIASPSKQLPLSALKPPATGETIGTAKPRAPPRPVLRREGSSGLPPPPPSQPPPAPPGPSADVADSLSLPQLRQLVSQFPKTEQRAYAFQYKEAEDFKKEVDEWFHYTESEQDREYVLIAREAFEQRWKSFCQNSLGADDAPWMEVSHDSRLKFMRSTISDLSETDSDARLEVLCSIYYVLTGTWSITSGLDSSHCSSSYMYLLNPATEQYDAVQLEWMHRGADLVTESMSIGPLYACLFGAARPSAESRDVSEGAPDSVEAVFDEEEYRELSVCLSCFYLLIESARVRSDSIGGRKIRQEISALSPRFILFLVTAISRLRWDESYNIPLVHAIQLLWKAMLLLFGDIHNNLEDVKSILQPRVDPFSSEAANPVLTASPLDYHLFRQEVTSKYPAYNPPLPLIPLELEQRTMLPMSQNIQRPEVIPATFPSSAPSGSSILHQPVHIATPAPSPPPSPIGPGGKAGKKQNYQTNQNFPFLYPPLDSSSNDLGGKGSTELQDLMATKRWEGSDIPTSIIEAGELFASRMRMTRAMRQLWKQRDLFMTYDRGWAGESTKNGDREPTKGEETGSEDLDGLDNPDLRARMRAVEDFFHYALPDMQSLIIVLMKVMLSNVQDIAVRNGNLQDPSQPTGGLNRTKSNSNVTAQSLPMPPPPPKPADMSLEDLDNVRSREISQKAISALIFLLLKWLKISHILKSEYLTQLLLDSNYVQLTLKYFAHQNLEDLVAFKYDRDDLSFFHYCHLHSDHPPLSPTSPTPSSPSSSADEALPPPISRHRRSPTSNSSVQPDTATNTSTNPDDPTALPQTAHPSVDELGNPLAPLPSAPITDFSFRQFQTSIHLLRTLQKVTRSKAHRILMLVQFKSSQILRRVLRVPDPMLRLYVLKLFKSQVPYCGRKWRQSNMRVITAIYLHCRPELRDEWLAGMHEQGQDQEVEDAVPLEWALRGLTWWWQKRGYADVIRMKGESKEGGVEGGQEIEDEERDFFQRELDLLGWGLAGLRSEDEVGFGEEAAGLANGGGGRGGNGGNVGGGAVNGGGRDRDGEGEWMDANARTLEAWQNVR